MTFRVGMKVVCVDAQETVRSWSWKGIRTIEGKIYTVRGVLFFPNEGLGLVFEEIQNKLHEHSGQELAYSPRRFRPLVDTKTEISFTQGADPDSEQYDNRRRIPVSEWGCSA